jgi:hypothetical protein
MFGIESAAPPFARGYTFNDAPPSGGLVTLGDTGLSEYEGKIYEVPDTVHGTGRPVLLMIVKNDTGAAITVARKFAAFSAATSLDHGRRIGTFPNGTAGGVVVALDDGYTVGKSIADDDLFFVLIYGPCSIGTPAAVTNLTAGESVASDNAGLIANTSGGAAAGEYVAGTLDYAASYTANSTAKVLVDCRNFAMPPAAG